MSFCESPSKANVNDKRLTWQPIHPSVWKCWRYFSALDPIHHHLSSIANIYGTELFKYWFDDGFWQISFVTHLKKSFNFYLFSFFLLFFRSFFFIVVALFGILHTLTASPEGLQVIFAWLHPCSVCVLCERFLLDFIVYIDLLWCHIWGCIEMGLKLKRIS